MSFMTSGFQKMDLETSVRQKHSFKQAYIPCLVGLILIVAVPFFHITIFAHLWNKSAFRVDKDLCTCSCWDTVFKGSYEAGVAGYKHVYFNATSNTLKIWIATAIFMISSYESVKYLLQLSLRGKLRYSMFILFASVYYSHYYAWWGYFNYWNDDFYSQWNHQLFFTITELVSTICVLTMCDKTVDISVKKCYIILSIALAHILISCVDQFILNIVLGEGKLHQVLRDLFLMLPDLLHVIMPLHEMKKVASRNNKTVNNLMPARYALFSVSGIFFLFTLSRYL